MLLLLPGATAVDNVHPPIQFIRLQYHGVHMAEKLPQFVGVVSARRDRSALIGALGKFVRTE